MHEVYADHPWYPCLLLSLQWQVPLAKGSLGTGSLSTGSCCHPFHQATSSRRTGRGCCGARMSAAAPSGSWNLRREREAPMSQLSDCTSSLPPLSGLMFDRKLSDQGFDETKVMRSPYLERPRPRMPVAAGANRCRQHREDVADVAHCVESCHPLLARMERHRRSVGIVQRGGSYAPIRRPQPCHGCHPQVGSVGPAPCSDDRSCMEYTHDLLESLP